MALTETEIAHDSKAMAECPYHIGEECTCGYHRVTEYECVVCGAIGTDASQCENGCGDALELVV